MPAAIFYNNPVALNSERHGGLHLAGVKDLGFARDTNVIPINLIEFPQAAKCYPIGFLGGKTPVSVAIVGLGADNLFVDGDGRWKPGAYIPAYVRRYPFILANGAKDKELVLCVEDAPGVLSADTGAPLFDKAAPSQATREALDFCRAYHAASIATTGFGRALAAADLLVDRQANATLTSGEAATLSGFKAVDPDRIQALSPRLLSQWNGRNWLVPLFAHVQSMSNWGDLAERLAARGKAAA